MFADRNLSAVWLAIGQPNEPFPGENILAIYEFRKRPNEFKLIGGPC